MKDNLIIIGAGNVGGFLALNLDLFDAQYKIVGFLDDDESKRGKFYWNIPVLGKIEDISNYADHSIVIGISNPAVKKQILSRIGENYNFPNFISKNSWISNKVEVGKGIIIYPNVSINHESKINDFVIINMNCAIGHNSTIGKGSSLAPGVNFAGFTSLEEFVEVGIGATTVQQINIGARAIIGGQSMVIKNIEANSTYVGVPAIKK